MSLSEPIIKNYTQPSCTLQTIDRTPGARGAASMNAPIQFEVRFHDSQVPEEQQIRIQGDRHSLVELHEVVKNYVQTVLASSPERFNALLVQDAATPTTPSELDVASSTPAPNSGREIYIQPGEGLSHNLFLGGLATPNTGQFIALSMTQLFDLANALDEYATDVLAPTVNFDSPTRRANAPSTAWAKIAAVLLVGVGLTAGIVHLLNRSDEPQTASRPSQTGDRSLEQPTLQPSVSPTLSPEALPSLPPTTNLPSPTTSPTLGNLPNTPIGSSPTSTTPLPGSIASTTPPTTTAPTPPSTTVSPLPGIAQAPPTTPQTPTQRADDGTAQPSSIVSLPGITSNNNRTTPPTPNRAAQTPPTIAVPVEPPSNPTPTRSVEGLTARERIRAALEGKPVDEPPAKSSQQTTQAAAFAPTPQVNEVRDYFQQRWKPPTGLSESLEYSIVLDVDGSVQRIEPLGKAARNYVDSSGLPQIGEPFVSANPQGETPRVRVILGADGKVQSFLEPN